jgi:hypothetical protein
MMEETRFTLDGSVEDTEEQEELEEEEAQRGPGIYIVLALFIILFLTATSALLYFQCYQGNGRWDFSFHKQSSDALLLNEQVLDSNQVLRTYLDSLNTLLLENNEAFHSLFDSADSDVIFEVQIGYFRSFDFSRYDTNLVNMNVEYANGAYKLLVGRFTDFSDACAFRRDMIDMGIKGAFVVKKEFGERVPFNVKCP